MYQRSSTLTLLIQFFSCVAVLRWFCICTQTGSQPMLDAVQIEAIHNRIWGSTSLNPSWSFFKVSDSNLYICHSTSDSQPSVCSSPVIPNSLFVQQMWFQSVYLCSTTAIPCCLSVFSTIHSQLFVCSTPVFLTVSLCSAPVIPSCLSVFKSKDTHLFVCVGH